MAQVKTWTGTDYDTVNMWRIYFLLPFPKHVATDVEALIAQEELSENNTTYIHFVITFKNKKTLNGVKSWFDRRGMNPWMSKPENIANSVANLRSSTAKVEGGFQCHYGEIPLPVHLKRLLKLDERDSHCNDEDSEVATKKKKRETLSHRAYNYIKNGGVWQLICQNLGAEFASIDIEKIVNVVKGEKQYELMLKFQRQANDFWKGNEAMKPWKWQLELKAKLDQDMCKFDDDRKVYCIVGNDGNNGKSTFAKYLCLLDPERRKVVKSGKTADMSFLIRNMHDVEVICMDLTRADTEYFQSKFLETLKDCMIQTTKYQSTQIYLPKSPTCVIFTNKHLQWHALSKDRWCIADLSLSTTYDEDKQETFHELCWWNKECIEDAWIKSRDSEVDTTKCSK